MSRILIGAAALVSFVSVVRGQEPAREAAGVREAAGALPQSRTLRLGLVMWLRGNREHEEKIVPPVYSNHLPKSLTFETLVAFDLAGNLRPGLAERWESSDDMRRHVFWLRRGATFHDGSPCDAHAVKRYLEAFLLRDEDRFIGLCERIAGVDVVEPNVVALRTSEPYWPFTDLSLMNPFGVVGGKLDGIDPVDYLKIGCGPWRVVGFEPMQRTQFVRNDAYDGEKPELERFDLISLSGGDRSPLSTWALERGHVDALIESWRPSIPREQAKELVDAGVATIVRGPGSMVTFLTLNSRREPFAQRAWRKAVRDAIDRDALVRAAEHGFGRPCTTMFPPELIDWPESGAPSDPPGPPPPERVPVEMLVLSTDPSQVMGALELQRQLRPHGIDVDVVMVTPKEFGNRSRAGAFDMILQRTWGAPYDPQATLYSRFRAQTQQRRSVFFAEPELNALIESAMPLPAGPDRAPIYERIQALLDDRMILIPLYIPDRIALMGPEVEGIELGETIYSIDVSRMRWRK